MQYSRQGTTRPECIADRQPHVTLPRILFAVRRSAATASPMSRGTFVVAAVLLVVLVGAGAWWWSQPDAGERPPAPAQAPSATQPGAPNLEQSQPVPSTVIRTPVDPNSRSEAPIALPPQGLRGHVLDSDHRVLAGIEVHLLESAGNDPLALPMQQRRHAFGALATTRTGDDGAFAIGLPAVQDKIYDLFLVSPRHTITRLGGLRLLAGQWHDLGIITMVAGATLRGQVTVVGHPEIAVPQATVRIDVGTAFDDAALRSLPNQERSLSATVDANGQYEIEHAPARGVVRVSAVAPGFARAIRTNIELSADGPVVVDFALAPGLGIRGSLVGTDGAAIAAARVEATPTEVVGDASSTTSDSFGRFELFGLVKGKYRVRVDAPGFEIEDRPGVLAGSEDLRLTLTPRTVVRVRVRTDTGTVLHSYQLGLRRYFAEPAGQGIGGPGIGGQVSLVVDVPDQRVRLDSLTDQALLHNVPTGVFVCQVEAEGFAKTLSPAFACGRRDDAIENPEVEVVLQHGGTLRGVVRDEQGVPLAGATVTTQPDGATPDNPLFKMIAGNIADRITSLQVTTGSDGAFELPRLAHAAYQIMIDPVGACRTIVRGIHVEQDGDQDLGTVTVPIGAEVIGHATLGGRVAGQMKVVLNTSPTETTAEPLRLETITDANGAFRLPRRVPPGTYELRVAVVGTTEPEAQIFRQLLQLQHSATTVSVPPGQRLVERDIDLAEDH